MDDGPTFSKDLWCCPTSRPYALGNHRITLAKAGGMGWKIWRNFMALHGTTPAEGWFHGFFLADHWHYTSHGGGIKGIGTLLADLALWDFDRVFFYMFSSWNFGGFWKLRWTQDYKEWILDQMVSGDGVQRGLVSEFRASWPKNSGTGAISWV